MKYVAHVTNDDPRFAPYVVRHPDLVVVRRKAHRKAQQWWGRRMARTLAVAAQSPTDRPQGKPWGRLAQRPGKYNPVYRTMLFVFRYAGLQVLPWGAQACNEPGNPYLGPASSPMALGYRVGYTINVEY